MYYNFWGNETMSGNSDAVAAVGGGTAACLLITGGLAGGCLMWAYVVWPAMTDNDDLSQLHNLGAWLITFLGPGEGFIGAFAAAAFGVGACLAGCVGLCTGAFKNDNTPNTIKNSEDAKRLDESAKALHAALVTIKEIKANNPADEQAVLAEAMKISQSLVEKGTLKPEEKQLFEKQLQDIVNGTLSNEVRDRLDEKVEQVKAIKPQTWLNWLGTSFNNSAARVTNLFRHTTPASQQTAQEQKLEESEHLNLAVANRV
jgi:hypothetical protein